MFEAKLLTAHMEQVLARSVDHARWTAEKYQLQARISEVEMELSQAKFDAILAARPKAPPTPADRQGFEPFEYCERN